MPAGAMLLLGQGRTNIPTWWHDDRENACDSLSTNLESAPVRLPIDSQRAIMDNRINCHQRNQPRHLALHMLMHTLIINNDVGSKQQSDEIHLPGCGCGLG
jgi:hypothetical protein